MSKWIRGICAVALVGAGIATSFIGPDRSDAVVFLSFALYVLADLAAETVTEKRLKSLETKA